MGSALSLLSMVSVTSARPSGGRPAVPAKMTSSILPPRSAFAPCSPSTQAMASTTLDLPDPLGPPTAVIPGSKCRVVAEANDLKPLSVSDFRYTWALVLPLGGSMRSAACATLPASGPVGGGGGGAGWRRAGWGGAARRRPRPRGAGDAWYGAGFGSLLGGGV